MKNMPALENSRIIEHLLEIIIKVVDRRTSKNVAVMTVDNAIKKLKPKYDFLGYVHIEDSLYYKKKYDVSVGSEINAVKTDDLGKAIDEIFSEFSIDNLLIFWFGTYHTLVLPTF